MTKYERELQAYEHKGKYLPKSVRYTKSCGRKIREAQKAVRKAQFKVEQCRIACLALPKPWKSYQRKPTIKRSYARHEVTDMMNALERLEWKEKDLDRAKEVYANRFTDRQKCREELRALPVQIACLKSLIEIAAKKRKPKKEKDPRAGWIEVAPGYFVEKYRVVTYCRTLQDEPVKNISGGFYVISHQHGYAKFALKQLYPGTAVECHA